MAKANKSLNTKNKRNLIIVGVVVLLIGIVAYFGEKQKINDFAVEQTANADGVQVVLLKPDQGCRILEPQKLGDVTTYECNLLVRNISDKPLEWVGQIEGLDGAKLTNNGEGTVEPNNNTVVQLWVPVRFCEQNPQGKGIVTIMDAEKSSNQSLASFYCSDVPSEGESEAPAEE